MGSTVSSKDRSAVIFRQAMLYATVLAKSGVDAFTEVQKVAGWKDVRLGRVVCMQRGWTLLHLAAWKGDLPLASLLYEQGCSPNALDFLGDTPLSLADELQDSQFLSLFSVSTDRDCAEKPTNSTLEQDFRLKQSEVPDNSEVSIQHLVVISGGFPGGEAQTKIRPV